MTCNRPHEDELSRIISFIPFILVFSSFKDLNDRDKRDERDKDRINDVPALRRSGHVPWSKFLNLDAVRPEHKPRHSSMTCNRPHEDELSRIIPFIPFILVFSSFKDLNDRDKRDERDKDRINDVPALRRSGHVPWSEFLNLDAVRPEHKPRHSSMTCNRPHEDESSRIIPFIPFILVFSSFKDLNDRDKRNERDKDRRNDVHALRRSGHVPWSEVLGLDAVRPEHKPRHSSMTYNRPHEDELSRIISFIPFIPFILVFSSFKDLNDRDKRDERDKDRRNDVPALRRSGHVPWSEVLGLDAVRPEHKPRHSSMTCNHPHEDEPSRIISFIPFIPFILVFSSFKDLNDRDKRNERDKDRRNDVPARRRSGHVPWSEVLGLDVIQPGQKPCDRSLSLDPLFLAVAGFAVPSPGRCAFFDESSIPMAG